uniref:Uncharacterized protein n=1 Tax=Latimeria chalumnae TaxID=7897 RepID=H3A266_LATCH
FFMNPQSLIQATRLCMIKAISLSDHVPVELVLRHGPKSLRARTWFNTLILQNKTFCVSLQQHLHLFLEHNLGSDARTENIWEACKAFIRGQALFSSSVVYYSIKLNRERLKFKSSCLCLKHFRASTGVSLMTMGRRCKSLKASDFIQLLKSIKCLYYEQGEKGSRLLTYRLKQQEAERVIPCIYNQQQQLITNPETINNTFKFYRQLYASEVSPTETELDNFFQDLHMPKLTFNDASILDLPIMVEEVHTAIKSL